MIEKTALVLEGGGFRGAYTAGCMQWLKDHGIDFRYIVSISATAVYSFYYAGDEMEALHDLSTRGIIDKHVIGLIPLLNGGTLVGYDYLLEEYVKPVYDRILPKLQNSDLKFEVGAYNMTQQQLQYKKLSDLDPEGQLLKATCVLPLTGRMTAVDGNKYLDGGMKTMVSVDRAEEMGYKKQLVIVTKDKNYVRKPNGWFIDTLMKIVYHNYPVMLETLDHRVDAYYEQMQSVYDKEAKGEAILIRPSDNCGVKRFFGTQQQLEKLFRVGWQDMEDRRDEILEFLKEN
ncbi:MAG: patatin-like phospholipase family protein [Erysipelotrichaceae bacterium]|nr:patatin-like phospholipase family protein [Erysipelotrichaceae bacterium]